MCSGIVGRLSEKVVFECGRCMGAIKIMDTQEIDYLKRSEVSSGIVDNSCYLGAKLVLGEDLWRLLLLE